MSWWLWVFILSTIFVPALFFCFSVFLGVSCTNCVTNDNETTSVRVMNLYLNANLNLENSVPEAAPELLHFWSSPSRKTWRRKRGRLTRMRSSDRLLLVSCLMARTNLMGCLSRTFRMLSVKRVGEILIQLHNTHRYADTHTRTCTHTMAEAIAEGS